MLKNFAGGVSTLELGFGGGTQGHFVHYITADTMRRSTEKQPFVGRSRDLSPKPMEGGEGRGGEGLGTRPWCSFVCLWRRLLTSRHCTSRPTVGPNVFWLCQRSPGGESRLHAPIPTDVYIRLAQKNKFGLTSPTPETRGRTTRHGGAGRELCNILQKVAYLPTPWRSRPCCQALTILAPDRMPPCAQRLPSRQRAPTYGCHTTSCLHSRMHLPLPFDILTLEINTERQGEAQT